MGSGSFLCWVRFGFVREEGFGVKWLWLVQHSELLRVGGVFQPGAAGLLVICITHTALIVAYAVGEDQG